MKFSHISSSYSDGGNLLVKDAEREGQARIRILPLLGSRGGLRFEHSLLMPLGDVRTSKGGNYEIAC